MDEYRDPFEELFEVAKRVRDECSCTAKKSREDEIAQAKKQLRGKYFVLFSSISKLVLSVFALFALIFILIQYKENEDRIKELERDLVRCESAKDACQKDMDFL